MSDEEIRLKCLELAQEQNYTLHSTIEYAKLLYDFVLGKSDIEIDAAIKSRKAEQ